MTPLTTVPRPSVETVSPAMGDYVTDAITVAEQVFFGTGDDDSDDFRYDPQSGETTCLPFKGRPEDYRPPVIYPPKS